MFLRLLILACSLLALFACSKNMKMNVRPPECTVNEKADCPTLQREPNAMAEEPFFQRK